MPKNKIKLGDEIEDVTSKLKGIVVGRIEYLSGATYWIVQPYAMDGESIPKTEYIPEAYCKYSGTGVYPDPTPPMGFRAGNGQGA
jgi:hypothetical protein